jgi:predicted RNA-binding Zn-ribbon protein involved in translation (DUF1610 family)
VKLPEGLTEDMIIDAVSEDSNTGFCLACGAEDDGVEPDAERYECPECGAEMVFGAEQILLML